MDNSLTNTTCLSVGRGLKANIFKVNHGDKQVILKDYSKTPSYLKAVAKILVKREVRALARLQGSPHVPVLFGLVDPYRIMMEYIDGVHPGNHARVQQHRMYLDAMDFLSSMHKAGIIHNDLRRKNLIIHPHRGLVFIDFAAALITPGSASSTGNKKWLLLCWLIRKLQHADLFHLVRIKNTLSPEPLTGQETSMLSDGRPFRQITNLWKALFRRKRSLLQRNSDAH